MEIPHACIYDSANNRPLRIVDARLDIQLDHYVGCSNVCLKYAVAESVTSVFCMPIGWNQTLASLELQINEDPPVRAQIEESGQALKLAVSRGQTSVLATTDQLDQLSLSLGVLPASSVVQVNFVLVEELQCLEGGMYRWIMPLAMEMKYTSPMDNELDATVRIFRSMCAPSTLAGFSVTVEVIGMPLITTSGLLKLKLIDGQHVYNMSGPLGANADMLNDVEVTCMYTDDDSNLSNAPTAWSDGKFLTLQVGPSLVEAVGSGPSDYVFLVDCSGSMHDVVSIVRKVIVFMINVLDDDSRVAVVKFGREHVDLFDRMLAKSDLVASPECILSRIDSGMGETNVLGAVEYIHARGLPPEQVPETPRVGESAGDNVQMCAVLCTQDVAVQDVSQRFNVTRPARVGGQNERSSDRDPTYLYQFPEDVQVTSLRCNVEVLLGHVVDIRRVKLREQDVHVFHTSTVACPP